MLKRKKTKTKTCFSLLFDRDPNPLPSKWRHPSAESNRTCKERMGVLAGCTPRLHTGVNAELERKQHRSHRLSMRPLRPWLTWCSFVFTTCLYHHLSFPFLISKTIKCKHTLNILLTDWVWPKRRNFISFQFSHFLYGSLSFNSLGNRKILPITFINWMKGYCGTLIPFPFAWSVPYFPGCKLRSQMFL